MLIRLLRPNLIYLILIFAIWLLFYLPIINNINYAFNERDWYMTYYFADTFKKIVLEYHQFPFRTPFMAGGYPIIGHPYDISLSPLSMFILIFGSVKGPIIIALLLSLVGVLGMFYLTKNVLKYNNMGALFSTLVLMLCKWGLNIISNGRFEELYYWLVPWLLAFLIRSKDDSKFIIFSGFILYFIVVHAGLILIPVVLFLGLFSCINSIKLDRYLKFKIHARYCISFLLIIIFTISLSAVKVFPILQLNNMRSGCIHLPFEDHYQDISKFSVEKGKALTWPMYRRALLDRDFFDLPQAMYLGYVPLILCGLSFLFYPLQTWRHLFLLVILMFFQMGANAPIDIFKWLWHLHPIIHGIWKLHKYFIFFIFFSISLVGGRFFQIFERLPRRRRYLKLIGLVLIMFCAIDMFEANTVYYSKEIIYKKIPNLKQQDVFFQLKLNDSFEYGKGAIVLDKRHSGPLWRLLLQNIGLVNFGGQVNMPINEAAIPKYIVNTVKVLGDRIEDEEVLIPEYEVDKNIYSAIFDGKKHLLPAGYVNPLYKGEIFFLDKKNNVSLKFFSPNKILADINLHSPDILVINQNYHRSWKSDKGKIINHNGLLAVKVNDKGSYLLQLDYIPFDFYIGLTISIITLIIAIFLLKRSLIA